MDPKDRRLIVAIVLAFLLWVGLDRLLTPRPSVLLTGGTETSVYQAAAESSAKPAPAEDAIDPSKFLPAVDARKVANTVYEKPYEAFFDRAENRETLLSLVRREPVVELSGVNDPTVLKREGGTVSFSLRVKGYYGPLYDVSLEFICPQGWEYIPGTVTSRSSDSEALLSEKLASLEDRVRWARAGKIVASYATDKAVEPAVKTEGEPYRVHLAWQFAQGLAAEQSMFLEFPLQTNGKHLPGDQEFVVKVTGWDRTNKGSAAGRHMVYAEMVLRVDVTDEETLLKQKQPFRDWDSLLLSSGAIPGVNKGSSEAKCCTQIGKGYRQPLSGVGF